MYKRLLLFLVLFFFLATLNYAGDNQKPSNDKWKYFKLYKTTEQSVLLIFGTPDAVKIEGTYDEIKKVRDTGNKLDLSECTLRYEYNRMRGDLNILKGPLGEASSVEVWLFDGIVVEVDWEYSTSYKDAAEIIWRNDKSYERYLGTPGRTITFAQKKLEDGSRISVDCFTGKNGNCSGNIRVMLTREAPSKSK